MGITALMTFKNFSRNNMLALSLINLLCVVFSAWLAHGMFKAGHNTLGWLNVFASVLNLAIVVYDLTGVM